MPYLCTKPYTPNVKNRFLGPTTLTITGRNLWEVALNGAACPGSSLTSRYKLTTRLSSKKSAQSISDFAITTSTLKMKQVVKSINAGNLSPPFMFPSRQCLIPASQSADSLWIWYLYLTSKSQKHAKIIPWRTWQISCQNHPSRGDNAILLNRTSTRLLPDEHGAKHSGKVGI